jgi:rhodanese-related sulfurtransferase
VTPSASAKDHPDHPYQVLGFDQVVEIFRAPETAIGGNVFVDARDEDVYAEGHIPGAIRADHYRLQECIDTLLEYAQSAERIIAYCNGGDCEDSIFLCTDLIEFEVPYERIYLYPGGWEEWQKKGMPVEKGLK